MISYDMWDISQQEWDYIKKKSETPSQKEQIPNDPAYESMVLKLKKHFSNIEDIILKSKIDKKSLLQTYQNIKKDYAPQKEFYANNTFLKYLEIIILNENNKNELDDFSKQGWFENFSSFLEKYFLTKSLNWLLVDEYSNNYILKSNASLQQFWKNEIISLSNNSFENQIQNYNLQTLNSIIEKNKFLSNLLTLTYWDNFLQNLKNIIPNEILSKKDFWTIIWEFWDNIFSNWKIENINIWDYIIMFQKLWIKDTYQILKNSFTIKYQYTPSKFTIDTFSNIEENLWYKDLILDPQISDFFINVDKFSEIKNFDTKSLAQFISNQPLKVNDVNKSISWNIWYSLATLLDKMLKSKWKQVDIDTISLMMKNKQAQNSESINNMEYILKYLTSNELNPEIESSIDSLIESFWIQKDKKIIFKSILSKLTPTDYSNPQSLVIWLLELKKDANLSKDQNAIIQKILSPLYFNWAFDISWKENDIYWKFFETILKTKKETLWWIIWWELIDEKVNSMILEWRIPADTNIELLRFSLNKVISLDNIENIFSDKNLSQKIAKQYIGSRMNVFIDQLNLDPWLVWDENPEIIKNIMKKVSENPNDENIQNLLEYLKQLQKSDTVSIIYPMKIQREIENIIIDEKWSQNVSKILSLFTIQEIEALKSDSKQKISKQSVKIDNLIDNIKSWNIDWMQIYHDQTPKNEIQPWSALDKYAQSHQAKLESSQADATLESQMNNWPQFWIEANKLISPTLDYNPNQATFSVAWKTLTIPRNWEPVEQFKTKLNLLPVKLSWMQDFILDWNTDQIAKIFNLKSFELNSNDLKQTSDKFWIIIFNLIDEKIKILQNSWSDPSQLDKLREIANEFFAHWNLEWMRKFFTLAQKDWQPIKLQEFFSDSQIFGQIFSLKDNKLHLECEKMAWYLEQNGLFSSMRIEKYLVWKQLSYQN